MSLESILQGMPPVRTQEDVVPAVRYFLSNKLNGVPLHRLAAKAAQTGRVAQSQQQTLMWSAASADYYIKNKELFEQAPKVENRQDVPKTVQWLIQHRQQFPTEKEQLSLRYLAQALEWSGKTSTTQQQTLERTAGAADYYLQNQDLFDQAPKVENSKDVPEAVRWLIQHRNEFPTKQETLSLIYLAQALEWSGKTSTTQQQPLERSAAAADYAAKLAPVVSPQVVRESKSASGLARRLSEWLVNQKSLKKIGVNTGCLPDALKEHCKNGKLSIRLEDWLALDGQTRTYLKEQGVKELSDSYKWQVCKWAKELYG